MTNLTLDSLSITALRHDLARRFLQARIERIFQPDRGDLLFQLRKGTVQGTLFFSSTTPCPWLGLIRQAPGNPSAAPAFCMLLRKYLAGGRLLAIEQPSFERRLELVVQRFDEAAGLDEFRLRLEFMGRRGNAILTGKEERILDALWRSAPGSTRDLTPGALYEPPAAAGRLNPETIAQGTFANLLAYAPAGQNLRELLSRKLLGISAHTAGYLLAEAGIDPLATAGSLTRADFDRLFIALSALVERVRLGRFTPRTIWINAMPAEILTFAGPPADGERVRETADLAEAMGEFCGLLARDELLSRQRTSLLGRIEGEIRRTRRKQEKQATELNASEDAARYRDYGELLLSHLASIPKGVSEIELPSWHDQATGVSIPLDPALDPTQNAQAHFRRYQRAKRAQTAVAAQLAKTQAELDYLRQLQYFVKSASSARELGEIAAEMAVQGLLPKAKAKAQAAPKQGGPSRYRSSDGHEILVGRNNQQNEAITFRLAGAEDIWFHAREIPGAHVVIKRGDSTYPPDRTLLEAANLAVYHSTARSGSKVPVDYAERKHVRKKPGGRPGAVHYDHFRTIIVDPDEEILKNLRLL